ncbi:MAG: energy transducer TonB [Sphingomicrobium sp.]
MACVSQTLQAREVRRLEPSSKWIIDYADDNCRIARSFGEGPGQVALIFDQFAPGDWLSIMFAGKSLDTRNKLPPIEAVIRFGPNEAESEITGVAGTLGDRLSYMVDGSQRLAPLTKAEQRAGEEAQGGNAPYGPLPLGAAREQAATWLALRKVFSFDLVLQTGPMNGPLEALRRCTSDLVRGWGLDVEQQMHLSRHLVPIRSESWFSESDYPKKMLDGGHQSIVNYRLIVDTSGKPESCHIQTSTRPKDFDDHVCRIVMKRARFDPALDAAGKPVRSYWRQTINFRIAG